jgi:hypothetical protein
VLFDDLIVTGNSFKQVLPTNYSILAQKKVTGAILGETVKWQI